MTVWDETGLFGTDGTAGWDCARWITMAGKRPHTPAPHCCGRPHRAVVPANSTATLRIPTADPDTVRESRTPRRHQVTCALG